MVLSTDWLDALVAEVGLLATDEDEDEDEVEDDDDDCADVLDGAEDVDICVMVAEAEPAALDVPVAEGCEPHAASRAAARAVVAMKRDLGARVLIREC
ncbi:hypothetical protein JL107_16260 [Nakamurella flavida]|uniref:Uncharacterized protein n=1 Tax=Nakamurella flavida TaxID=363630 RepID=A0A939C1S8_9ACTN|nr:hypothetical protein [Nakamurella flavida]MBM9478003.1 hypothetical protein [Nakamurella flavida]MDP9778280.1 hypothetical protein [Nakamurella flavida]